MTGCDCHKRDDGHIFGFDVAGAIALMIMVAVAAWLTGKAARFLDATFGTQIMSFIIGLLGGVAT